MKKVHIGLTISLLVLSITLVNTISVSAVGINNEIQPYTICVEPSDENMEPQTPFFSVISDSITLEIIAKNSTIHKLANETVWEWTVKENQSTIGVLTLEEYTIYNSDYYYFIAYHPSVTSGRPLTITLPFKFESFSFRYLAYPRGLDNTKSVWQQTDNAYPGIDLPISSIFIDSEAQSCFLSYVNVFEKQENEVKREMYELSKPISVNEDSLTLHMENIEDAIIEHWGVVSKQPLVDWSFEGTKDSIQVADLNRVRKWSMDGQYYVTPSSYFPSSDTSFWRNPAHHIGEKFSKTEGGRFFEDFSIISRYTAIKKQNKKGYWYTTPRSDWLYEDYGIGAFFYDTRFNTDAGLFLLRGYKQYRDTELLNAAVKYGNFLVEFSYSNSFRTKNDGLLVWDYGYSPNPYIATHVSLNHLITEMNYLFELYKVTNNYIYYFTADRIRTAVKDTCTSWEREGGDLWYAYMADGSYGLNDYPTLTLNDLIYSQTLIKNIYGSEDHDFQKLIQIKQENLDMLD